MKDLFKFAAQWARERRPGVIIAINPHTKHPFYRGWTDLDATDLLDIHKACAEHKHVMLGCTTGKASGFWGADVDGDEGKATIAKLEAQHGRLPPPRFTTPSGGVRYVFRWVPGLWIRTTAGQIGAKVDQRGHRPDGKASGETVIPPSVRADGKAYQWCEGYSDFSDPPEAPLWFLFLAVFSQKERERLAAAGVTRHEDLAGAPPTEWRAIYEAKVCGAGIKAAREKKLKAGKPRPAPEAFLRPLSEQEKDRITKHLTKAFGNLCAEIRQAPDSGQERKLNDAGMRIHGLLNGARHLGLDVVQLEAQVFAGYVAACLDMTCHRIGEAWTEDDAVAKWDHTSADATVHDLGHLLDDSGFTETVDFGAGEAPKESEAPQAAPEADGLISQRASEIEPKKLEFIWPGRLPKGKCITVAGDGGLGKSTMLDDIIARITKGAEWPDGTGKAPLGSVILMCAEDSADDTVVPRLMAADADLSKVHIVRAVRKDDGKGRRTFSLAEDVHRLEAMIKRVGDVAAVVFDPISSYFGRTDTYRNSDVRGVLEPLGDLADRYGVTIIGNTHLSKNGKGSANARVLDSVAMTAHARGVHIVAEDPDNPDERLFIPSKTNLVKGRKIGLRFRIVEKIVDPVKDIRAGQVEWLDKPVEITADEALAAADSRAKGPSALDHAKDFLRGQLMSGPKDADEIKSAAAAECVSIATLRRAKEALNVVSAKVGFDKWSWSLGTVDASTSGFGPIKEATKH
jgi:AAA domain/Bifunctional DNA primase/polymerase, N-terminal